MNDVSTPNILLVEDNPGDVYLVKAFLDQSEDSTQNVTIASRLSETTNILEIHDIDLILLDLNLPDSEGLKTFVTLHNQYPHIPIVILTGMNDEELAKKSIQLGAQDFLVKDILSPKTLNISVYNAICRAGFSVNLKKHSHFLLELLHALPCKILVLNHKKETKFANRKWEQDHKGSSIFDYFDLTVKNEESKSQFETALNNALSKNESSMVEITVNDKKQVLSISKLPETDDVQISIISDHSKN